MRSEEGKIDSVEAVLNSSIFNNPYSLSRVLMKLRSQSSINNRQSTITGDTYFMADICERNHVLHPKKVISVT